MLAQRDSGDQHQRGIAGRAEHLESEGGKGGRASEIGQVGASEIHQVAESGMDPFRGQISASERDRVGGVAGRAEHVRSAGGEGANV